MKTIKNFKEFVNESLLTEASMKWKAGPISGTFSWTANDPNEISIRWGDNDYYVRPIDDEFDKMGPGEIKDAKKWIKDLSLMLKKAVDSKGNIKNTAVVAKMEKYLDDNVGAPLFGSETYNGWAFDDIAYSLDKSSLPMTKLGPPSAENIAKAVVDSAIYVVAKSTVFIQLSAPRGIG